jgi:hypothetical protein
MGIRSADGLVLEQCNHSGVSRVIRVEFDYIRQNVFNDFEEFFFVLNNSSHSWPSKNTPFSSFQLYPSLSSYILCVVLEVTAVRLRVATGLPRGRVGNIVNIFSSHFEYRGVSSGNGRSSLFEFKDVLSLIMFPI